MELACLVQRMHYHHQVKGLNTHQYTCCYKIVNRYFKSRRSDFIQVENEENVIVVAAVSEHYTAIYELLSRADFELSSRENN